MNRKDLPSAFGKGLASVLSGFILMAIAGWNGTASGDGNATGEIIGVPWMGGAGVQISTTEIMAQPPLPRPANWESLRLQREIEISSSEDRPQDPGSQNLSRWPPIPNHTNSRPEPGNRTFAPQTLGVNFNGATGPSEAGFPPDCMGAVGPTQFVVFLNGRVRTFNKSTGVADGVINVDSDVFFASVMTPVTPPGLNFTTDPQIRYDRLSGRWILIIIDVPSSSPSSLGDIPNRILIAVSDAASAGVISAGTIWTFYTVQQNTVGGGDSGEFLDYESLGIDNNALYVGGNMFGAVSGAFVGCSGFVIRKSSILSGGPVVTTAFRNIVSGGGEGPFSPRGVDNFDPAATEGYFIGSSLVAKGRLVMRRVSTPSGTPTLSSNILITVNSTSNPINVNHLGNTGGSANNLDAIDDRLFAAHIRNSSLWTAHNIAVTAAGVASGVDAQRRDAVRWYELSVPVGAGTPTVTQTGTIFDGAATVAAARQYWIPTVMVSGQGHAALGFSTAGNSFRIDAVTAGRLKGDPLGTTQAVAFYSTSTTAYNPGNNRWGDYSLVSLDPNDDMTMWTIQEYCDGTNTYGVRVGQLKPPPPANPDSVGPAAVAPLGSVNVAVRGTSTSGSGFYDPGANPAAPHTPFNHLSVVVNRVTGAGTVTVTSVTYQNPTHFTLNLNTGSVTALSTFRIVVTNPDGQKDSSGAILTVNPALPIQLASFTGTYVDGGSVRLNWTTVSEINNYGFEVQNSTDQSNNFETIAGSFVPGHGTTNQPQHYRYLHSNVSLGSYWYRLKQIDLDGSINYTEPILVSSATTVSEPGAPAEFSLAQNYPNPFNPTTEIKFSVETSGQARLDVFNIAGQQVGTLFHEMAIVGQYYKVKFDATNFPSGVYFYRLVSGRQSDLKKLLLLK